MMITSRQNPLVQQAKKLASSPGELALVEGLKLCRDAVEAGIVPLKILTTKKSEEIVRGFLPSEFPAVTLISDDIAGYISGVKTPQGVFFVMPRLDNSYFSGTIYNIDMVVLLENIQDPGNVGAIIRCAEAFGAGVILSSECANVNSAKVIRSSAGSVFRAKLTAAASDGLSGEVEKLRQNGFTTYAAVLDSGSLSLPNVKFVGKTAVVIGSEGQGLREETAAACNHKLYIPIEGAQSLNAAVAAGILLYSVFSKDEQKFNKKQR